MSYTLAHENSAVARASIRTTRRICRRCGSAAVILVAAMAFCGLVGFTIERLAYKPLRRAPRLNVLITAIGVSLLLQNVGQLNVMFGPSPQKMPALLPELGVVAAVAAERAAAVATWSIGLVDAMIIGTSAVADDRARVPGVSHEARHGDAGRVV